MANKIELDNLEQLTHAILLNCDNLVVENNDLRKKHKALVSERNELAEKNRIAYKKVKTLIERLKIIEKQL